MSFLKSATADDSTGHAHPPILLETLSSLPLLLTIHHLPLVFFIFVWLPILSLCCWLLVLGPSIKYYPSSSGFIWTTLSSSSVFLLMAGCMDWKQRTSGDPKASITTFTTLTKPLSLNAVLSSRLQHPVASRTPPTNILHRHVHFHISSTELTIFHLNLLFLSFPYLEMSPTSHSNQMPA